MNLWRKAATAEFLKLLMCRRCSTGYNFFQSRTNQWHAKYNTAATQIHAVRKLTLSLNVIAKNKD